MASSKFIAAQRARREREREQAGKTGLPTVLRRRTARVAGKVIAVPKDAPASPEQSQWAHFRLLRRSVAIPAHVSRRGQAACEEYVRAFVVARLTEARGIVSILERMLGAPRLQEHE